MKGRKRHIDPELRCEDRLHKCSAEAQILIRDLYLVCDKAGRIDESRNKIVILALLYAKTNKHVEAWLWELELFGLIRRYEVGSSKYLQISGWDEEKFAEADEPDSVIPPPTDDDA